MQYPLNIYHHVFLDFTTIFYKLFHKIDYYDFWNINLMEIALSLGITCFDNQINKKFSIVVNIDLYRRFNMDLLSTKEYIYVYSENL